MTKRAAIYICIEKQFQIEEVINQQKIFCENHAESAQLKVVKIYSDVSHSATLNQRPMFQKLLSDSKNGLFDVIIVQRAENIGHDMLDFAIYKQCLMNNGVELVIAEQTMKATVEERLQESILEFLIGPLINRLEEMKKYA